MTDGVVSYAKGLRTFRHNLMTRRDWSPNSSTEALPP
jgi:hypothetical protein